MEKPIALVLCGGGGKGAFQIGAWKALEEHGIMKNVKAISGTSVGALNAVLLALGDYKMAEEVWISLQPEDMLSYDNVNSDCLFSRDGMKKILKTVPLEKLCNSNIDVYITLRNKTLNRIEVKHINNLLRSDIEKILLATSAIPKVYPEVIIDGQAYEDAGIISLHNTPIFSVYDQGYRDIYIISLKSHFSLHGIDNGDKKIDADSSFPGCRFEVIKPLESLGGLIKGTLNFKRDKICKLIHRGYTQTDLELKISDSLGSLLKNAGFPYEIHRYKDTSDHHAIKKRTCCLKYADQNFKLIWDYTTVNNLLIRINIPGEKIMTYSLASSSDNKNIQRMFNQLISADGVEIVSDSGPSIHHGSKVVEGAFAGCKIECYADKVAIFDEMNDRRIFLVSENIQSCRLIKKEFRPKRIRTYYHFEVDYIDNDKNYSSHIRLSEKKYEYLKKYVPITKD